VGAAPRTERPEKGVEFTFHLVSMNPQDGFQQMDLRGSENASLYVATQTLFGEDEIVSIEAADNGLNVMVRPETAQRMRDRNVTQLGIMSNGRLVAAPKVEGITVESVARITGLSTEQANRMARSIKPRATVPVGSALTIVPREASGRSGDLFTVDVFLSGATNVRTYQLSIDTAGGRSGSLAREEAYIDADRTDYVFGTQHAIKAVDDVHGRMGAVLFDGGVNAPTAMYLGTYAFRASSDAEGDFTITARPDGETFLNDPEHVQLPFRVQTATISVGR
jgi:hypothetical protein